MPRSSISKRSTFRRRTRGPARPRATRTVSEKPVSPEKPSIATRPRPKPKPIRPGRPARPRPTRPSYGRPGLLSRRRRR